VSNRQSWSTVGVIVAIAALGALVLGLVGGLWGRTPAGNTALVVPFGGGPALVAGGWAAIVVAGRRPPIGPWRCALLTGGATLVASLAAIYLPLALSNAALPPIALVLAALLGALVARVLDCQPGRNGWLAFGAIALAAILLTALAAGFAAILNLLLVPLLVVLPLALSTPPTRTLALVASWFAVLIAVVVGVQLGGYAIALI